MLNYLFLIAFLLMPATAAAQDFGSLISPGELAKAHAQFEGLDNCTKCHVLGGGVPDAKCLDCHDKLAERIARKEGFHSRTKDPCLTCHREHKGRSFNLFELDQKQFDHQLTEFILEGKHAAAECAKCHKKEGTYVGLKTECVSCHKDYHDGQLPQNCNQCHGASDWKDVRKFNHDRDSKYALTGKHVDVACAKCHVKSNYRIPEFDRCATCHKDPHDGKPRCSECHGTEGWKKVKIDHSRTRYPLTGKHDQVPCAKCHVDNRLRGIPFKTCNGSGCHKDVHKNQFKDQLCESCHNTAGFKPSLFKHEAAKYTGFKLEGKHADTPCAKCHVDGRYKPIASNTCNGSGCHKDPHKGQFKNQRCDSCHNASGWKPSLFKHESPNYKGYKLEGKHAETPCAKCHIDGLYKPIPQECSNCHKKDDPHKNELGENCNKCHVPEDWKKLFFDHDRQSSFPLTGKHKETECGKCHQDKVYKIKKEACGDCHEDYHKGEFKEACNTCHTTADWDPKKFNHAEKTGFKLAGTHLNLVCTDCHKEKGEYSGISRFCYGCHIDPHFNQFGTYDCTQCHAQTSWNPLQFNHIRTGFPLMGNHRAAECEDCHKNRLYRQTPTACLSCHNAEYTSAPDHVSEGFNPDCRGCHGTAFISWDFNHATLSSATPCAECHLAEMPPSHSANQYGTDCALCHQFPNWDFDHAQKSAARPCADCHLVNQPSDHSQKGYSTDCATCHQYPIWDFDHVANTAGKPCSECHLIDRPASHESQNFSTACETCHQYPTWEFNHVQVSSGKACSECHLAERPSSHVTQNYSTTCDSCHAYPTWDFNHAVLSAGKACSECHLTDRPQDHVTQNFSTACETCHAYPTWDFNHAVLSAGKACSECHLAERPSSHVTQNYSTTCDSCHAYPTWDFNHAVLSAGKSCSECHLTEQPQSHITANYSTSCQSCHQYPTWIFTHPAGTTNCSACHLSQRPQSHITNNYATTCENCHQYPTWNFTHPAGTTNCSACHLSQRPQSHITNNYATTCENCHQYPTWDFNHPTVTTACSACHSTDDPPAHEQYAARFGPACETCHTYPGWLPATFSHSFSPFSIPHKGYGLCADCHPTQTYGNFGYCIECHTAEDRKVHNSNTNAGCLVCHPTGKD